jgi:hypothetical protein
MSRKDRLHKFLKNYYDNGLQVELTSENALRFAYTHLQLQEVLHLTEIIKVLRITENKKEIMNVLPFTNEQKILMRRSLWINLVVSYAKFFTSNGDDEASVPHLQLSSDSCYKTATSELIQMHEKLMRTRHKCVAHGTENDEEHVIPIMVLEKDADSVEGKLGIYAIGAISFSLEDLSLTHNLLNLLQVYLNKRSDKFVEKVYEEYKDIEGNIWIEHAKNKEPLDKP